MGAWSTAIFDDDGAAELERWKDSGKSAYQKRKETLEKLREKLLHVVNPPKKIRKCPAYYFGL